MPEGRGDGSRRGGEASERESQWREEEGGRAARLPPGRPSFFLWRFLCVRKKEKKHYLPVFILAFDWVFRWQCSLRKLLLVPWHIESMSQHLMVPETQIFNS